MAIIVTKLKINNCEFEIFEGQFKHHIELVRNHLWEPNTFDIFEAFLDQEHSYIDIGAWIGITSLYGCQLAKHCYAIEPDPIAFSYLKDNIALNCNLKSKITPFDYCIYHENGIVTLGNQTDLIGGDNQSSICFPNAPLTWQVPAITLEKFFDDNDIKDCNFIKMDIEGAEATVIPTMQKIIQKFNPTLFSAVHPYKFGDNFEQSIQGIVQILKNYNHIFTAHGLEISTDVLFNEGVAGPSYELLATNVNINDLRKTRWGSHIKTKSWEREVF